MDGSAAMLWWLAAGALVVVELVTGTFYLLMVALGTAAGALAAHAGAGGTVQVLCAAVVGIGATASWHLRRARAPRSAPAQANRDVNLDIGRTLRVDDWHADGTARVQYRGAAWSVLFDGEGPPRAGEHVIVAVEGNHLRVAPTAR